MERLNATQSLWSEEELLMRLHAGETLFPPARVRLLRTEWENIKPHPDGTLEILWRGRAQRFVFERKSSSKPKIVEMAMYQAQRAGKQLDMLPMVVIPYLSEEMLRMLEAENVSGIDLCGNGVVIAPDFALWRSGQPNRFTESQPIHNIYRGNVSLPARAFLLQNAFPSLVALRAFTLERLTLAAGEPIESKLTKGTISKVIQILNADGIVNRTQEGVRLLSAQRLLDALRNNATAPRGRRLTGKTSLSAEEIWNRLNSWESRAVVTGNGSAGRYGALSGGDTLTLYVDDLEATAKRLEVRETSLFPNITLIEEKSDVVYFDTREEGAIRWASPIQTWLELSLGGPREREAAQAVEAVLVKRQAEALR